jgi:hypothetical protein
VLSAVNHVVIRITTVDFATPGTAMVGIIHGLKSDLAFIALIPLIVLSTFGRKFYIALQGQG